MKKVKFLKFGAVITIATLFLLIPISTIVTADEIFPLWNYKSDEGHPGHSVICDSNDDVIVAGQAKDIFAGRIEKYYGNNGTRNWGLYQGPVEGMVASSPMATPTSSSLPSQMNRMSNKKPTGSGGSGNPSGGTTPLGIFDDLAFFDVTVDSNDNIIAVGCNYKNLADRSFVFVAKYSTGGDNLLWYSQYKNPNNHIFSKDRDLATAVVIDSNDNILICGGCTMGSHICGYVVKFDGANGEILTSETNSFKFNDIALDADENIYTVGTQTTYIPFKIDAVIIKYDNDLEKLDTWKIEDYSDTIDRGYGIEVSEDGDIFIVGSRFEGYDPFGNAYYYPYVVKLNPDGEKDWLVEEQAMGDFTDVSIRKNKVLAVGWTVNHMYRFYGVKLDCDTGEVVKEFSPKPDLNRDEKSFAGAMDLVGNVILTGYTHGNYPEPDIWWMYTTKMSYW